ncbi:MAG: ABC transporter ATP-binding protein, partial [Planifilum sp.]
TLNAEADIYILDEAELGMSNSYVDTVIRERIQKLARARKTIILATHNANLAVRTLPYLSVYREHINGNTYRTYIGNPFTNKLVDIEDSSNVLNWTEKSLEVLEGSSDAFYNRKDIYEAGLK